MKIYISGCHSGPNPSPGLGVARSLREAFPQAELIAKDHALQCSALHHPVFDSAWVSPPWVDVDFSAHLEELTRRLGDSAFLISGLDLEAVWLAKHNVRGALIPPQACISRVAKPRIEGFERLPKVTVPPWISLPADPEILHEFARANDWSLWVKGPAYGARRVKNWRTTEKAIDDLGKTWGSGGLFLQADVPGKEVSIAFCAYKGTLLDVVFMEKRSVTDEGKTWSGVIHEPDQELALALRGAIDELDWTGGGELEFVRDESGRLWLMDLNPRFPAWIYGATLAGHNLPARLVAAALGTNLEAETETAKFFTRVVIELPVRAGIPLPPIQASSREATDAGGKHPSGMPQLQRRLAATSERQIIPPRPFMATWLPELIDILRDRSTPIRWLLEPDAKARFEYCADRAREIAGDIDVRIAYSTKTNPDPRLLKLARDNSFLIEVISPGERALALSAGFSPSDLVHNGPVPAPEYGDISSCHAAFADSLESLANLPTSMTGITGARICPPHIRSRFGIKVEDPNEFSRCIDLLTGDPRPLGISMHVQSSVIGMKRWVRAAHSSIHFADAIGSLCRRPVTCMDLGGGWAWQDLDIVFDKLVPELIRASAEMIPSLQHVILEPGKMLVEPVGVTVTRVLELRNRAARKEVVVDGSVAELPMSRLRPHRIVAARDFERAELVGVGGDSILGRLCLEADVLRESVALPAWLDCGDFLIFLDTGAYDSSMSFPFGTWGSSGRFPRPGS